MLEIPRHDGTGPEPHGRLLTRLPLQVGQVLSATVATAGAPLLPKVVSVVGTHGVACFRRWSGLQWGRQIRFGEVEEIRLDEQYVVRGGQQKGVVHHFDFMGRFGVFRVSGTVDEEGHATRDSLYHFGMAALRAYRKYREAKLADDSARFKRA